MKDKYKISDVEDYISSVSATDCTGLIPANSVDMETLEDYKELYAFGSPNIEKAPNKESK